MKHLTDVLKSSMTSLYESIFDDDIVTRQADPKQIMDDILRWDGGDVKSLLKMLKFLLEICQPIDTNFKSSDNSEVLIIMDYDDIQKRINNRYSLLFQLGEINSDIRYTFTKINQKIFLDRYNDTGIKTSNIFDYFRVTSKAFKGRSGKLYKIDKKYQEGIKKFIQHWNKKSSY